MVYSHDLIAQSVNCVQCTGIITNYFGAFIAPLPIEKTTFGFKMFTAPLETDSKFVHSIANNCIVINKMPQKELCALLAIRILIANSCTRCRLNRCKVVCTVQLPIK